MESVRMALGSLRTNKMRALLTLLGVIIGIASVIAILTIGRSLQSQTLDGLESLGASDLTAQVEERGEDDGSEDMFYSTGWAGDQADAITEDMLDELQFRFADSISGVGISTVSEGHLIDGQTRVRSELQGINADQQWMTGIEVEYGRAITAEDVMAGRQVAIISPEALEDIYQGDPELAIGSEISFEFEDVETELSIVGVYGVADSQGLVSAYSVPTTYVPYPIAQEMTDSDEGFGRVSLRMTHGADQEAVKTGVQSFFDTIYRDNEANHVRITDMSRELQEFNQVITAMSLGVSAIGGISLLVGGIGVMNIMLVSVTERTREIGVRKALGARRRDIRLQFVVEAMIICLIGGVLGVLLGGGIGLIASAVMGHAVAPPLTGVLIALLFSMGIGLFFGYYPASKAAKLNPIEALRYE